MLAAGKDDRPVRPDDLEGTENAQLRCHHAILGVPTPTRNGYAGPIPAWPILSVMAYVVVLDVPASWERYTLLASAFDPVPDGLVIHAAGPTDEGFRTVEIWASQEDYERFRTAHSLAVGTLGPETLRTLDARATVCARTLRLRGA